MENSPYRKKCTKKAWILVLSGFFVCLNVSSSDARRIHLSPEQQAQLANANSVFVKVLALTEKGPADSSPFIETITTRLQELNYTVVTDPAQPHDIEFKVKCEERKTLTGTSTTGGDVDLSDAPDRLWKGPACLLTYQLDHRDLDWKKEIRTSFPDAVQAAQEANVDSAGQYAMTHLNQRLAEYEFPLLLSAEWGQVDRLLERLEHPKTTKLRKAKILSLLSDLQAQKALPKLTKLLESTDLQEETINALAGAGIDSIPLLIDFFETSKQSTIRAEAAKALGKVAAKSSDPRIIPPLVRYVSTILPGLKSSEDLDFPLLTEVVWAIGKSRWEESLKPIGTLQEKIWLIFDNSKEMADLREATSWTYKQLDLDGHIS
jgi:hypothetical protein